MADLGKTEVTQAIVRAEDAGQRLDNFLLRLCKGVPKSHVYRIIRRGEVRLNGGRASASDRVAEGDALRIPPVRLAAPEEVAAGEKLCAEIPIVFEDEAMLAVDKPAGLAVHGGSGVSFGVIEALRAQRPEARFLELAHRLDRETSGLLLVAKKRPALNALHAMFREGGRADKRYLLLARGRWLESERRVDLPLLKYTSNADERRVRVSNEGKPSLTVFRLLARWQQASLLEAQLRTGRTHQIRVHCAHLGFPIAGDEKYGDFDFNRALAREGLKRMFLHAWKMRFPHPASGQTLTLEAPLPAALRGFLDKLPEKETETRDHGPAL
ncbi:MAG: RluA family pseudouridine synthase [Candidatus Accumulibacter sp.]|jgi:23S rRNA pseudouridine955/2504/2580 synthase|nr:RluA family pseudouridine synthase [Accumulibacter sp.]